MIHHHINIGPNECLIDYWYFLSLLELKGVNYKVLRIIQHLKTSGSSLLCNNDRQFSSKATSNGKLKNILSPANRNLQPLL